MNPKFEALGMKPADILLPKAGTDMTKWAVVACDQFTSQPEYWAEVDRIAGDEPSGEAGPFVENGWELLDRLFEKTQ